MTAKSSEADLHAMGPFLTVLLAAPVSDGYVSSVHSEAESDCKSTSAVWSDVRNLVECGVNAPKCEKKMTEGRSFDPATRSIGENDASNPESDHGQAGRLKDGSHLILLHSLDLRNCDVAG